MANVRVFFFNRSAIFDLKAGLRKADRLTDAEIATLFSDISGRPKQIQDWVRSTCHYPIHEVLKVLVGDGTNLTGSMNEVQGTLAIEAAEKILSELTFRGAGAPQLSAALSRSARARAPNALSAGATFSVLMNETSITKVTVQFDLRSLWGGAMQNLPQKFVTDIEDVGTTELSIPSEVSAIFGSDR